MITERPTVLRGSSRSTHAAITEYETRTDSRECTACGQVKRLSTEFHRDRSARLGYCYQCKPCYREYKRVRQAANRAASPERYREYVRRAQRQPDFNDKRRATYAANPQSVLVHTANRRARALAADGTFTPDEFAALCESFGNVCLCCGADGPLEPDHVVPLSLGGTNWITNIQPLCRSCNARKGNRHCTDYRTAA